MRESFKKIIGFDTETVLQNNVNKFYSFQVFSPDLDLNVFCTDSDMLQDLFTSSTQGCYLVCANAEFDLSVIQQIIKNTRLKIVMGYTSSKFIRATIKDDNRHTWHIIDIFNVFPRYSVKKLGELLKIPKLDRPEYLGKREPSKAEMPYFKKYAMRDAEIAYYASKMVINEFGKIKSTLPSLTMSVFRKNVPDSIFWKQPIESQHLKIKESFHGGRVEPFARGSLYEDVFAYDVRSLYPSVMTNGIFPDISREPEYKTSVNFDNEGVALCTVNQDCLLPALCVKHLIKDVGYRLLFPNGKLKSWFTYPELRYIENNNYGKILQVHESIEWKRSFNPFKSYIKMLFDKRAEYLKEKSEKAEMYKLMMNSLYGKFAQNLDFIEYDFDNDVVKLKSKKGGIGKNTHFVLASYVTGMGRTRLHRMMMYNNGSDVLYCDTDGFLTTKNNHPVNDVLGGLTYRNEKEPIKLTTLIRSKMYIIDNTVKMRGLLAKIDGFDLRSRILNGQMKFTKEIILKPRQATVMHKEPLSMYTKRTLFTLKPDGKRNYIRNINDEKLITDFTESLPVEIKVV